MSRATVMSTATIGIARRLLASVAKRARSKSEYPPTKRPVKYPRPELCCQATRGSSLAAGLFLHSTGDPSFHHEGREGDQSGQEHPHQLGQRPPSSPGEIGRGDEVHDVQEPVDRAHHPDHPGVPGDLEGAPDEDEDHQSDPDGVSHHPIPDECAAQPTVDRPTHSSADRRSADSLSRYSLYAASSAPSATARALAPPSLRAARASLRRVPFLLPHSR